MERIFTSIQQIGRKALLNKLSAYKGFSNEQTVLGQGEDSAVISTNPEKQALLSSDTFVEGADFDPT